MIGLLICSLASKGPPPGLKTHLGKAAAQAGLRHKNEEFRLS